MDPDSEHSEKGLHTSEDSYRTASKNLGAPARWVVTEAHDDTFYKLLRSVTMGHHLRAGERMSTPAQIEERVNHICRVRYSFMANLYKLERMDAKLVRQCNLCRPCGGKFQNRIATLNFYSECGNTRFCPWCWGRDVFIPIWRGVRQACSDPELGMPLNTKDAIRDKVPYVPIFQKRTFKLYSDDLPASIDKMIIESEKVGVACRTMDCPGYATYFSLYPGLRPGRLVGRLTAVYMFPPELVHEMRVRAIMPVPGTACKDLSMQGIARIMKKYLRFPAKILYIPDDDMREVKTKFVADLLESMKGVRALKIAGAFKKKVGAPPLLEGDIDGAT